MSTQNKPPKDLAVRGIIAGETVIPIAEIGVGLADALKTIDNLVARITAAVRSHRARNHL